MALIQLSHDLIQISTDSKQLVIGFAQCLDFAHAELRFIC